MKKIWESYKVNFIKWTLLIFIILLLFLVAPIVFFNQTKIEKFVLSNKTFTGFLGVVGAITTLFFAAYQSIMERRQHIKSHELNRRVKAIDLAKEYKVFIDNELSYVVAGMETLGITKVMEKYKFSSLEVFDSYEMDQVISKDDRNFIKNALGKLDSEKLSIVYCRYNKNFKSIIESKRKQYLAIDRSKLPDFKLLQEKIKKSRTSLDNEESIQLRKDLEEWKSYLLLSNDVMEEDLKITSDFFDKLDSTMNNLEWFSMHFKNSVADDDVVYQSLHQSFLNTVRLLYTIISELNVIPYEKYYINIIWLYNHWKNKMECKKCEHDDFKKNQVTDKKAFKP